MHITMSDQVFQWYKNELSLNKGDFVRFYIRYGGFNSFIKGFSLGIEKDTPEKTASRVEKEGITFFVEEDDSWYFDNKNLLIEMNPQGEPEFFKH